MTRSLVLCIALLTACGGTKPPTSTTVATREIAIVGDLVMRGEADGLLSVMAAATLDGVTAFGVALMPNAQDQHDSAQIAVARARAWHALSLVLDEKPARAAEAMRRGMKLLPPCDGSSRETLRGRLQCITKQDETIVLDRERRVIVRKEHGGDVGVISTVELSGTVTAGYARLRGVPLEAAAGSTYATLARGRAWQLMARHFAHDLERSYEAARRGLHEMDCKVDRWRSAVGRAAQLHVEGAVGAARDLLRDVLDETIVFCVRQYHYRARTWKIGGRRAL